MPQRSDGRHEPVHMRLPPNGEQNVETFVESPVIVNVSQKRKEHDWSSLSWYCPNGLNHRTVDRILLHLIAQHYIEPVSISERKTPYTLVNDANVYETRTLPVYVFANMDRKIIGRYPAIMVQRGEQAYHRVAIDDRTAQLPLMTRGASQTATVRIPPNYCRIVTGVHICSCLSQSPGEVDALTVELADYLTHVAPFVLEYVPFLDFAVEKISPVAPVDGSGSIFVAQISISYAYEHAWVIERQPHAVVDLQIDVKNINTNLS